MTAHSKEPLFWFPGGSTPTTKPWFVKQCVAMCFSTFHSRQTTLGNACTCHLQTGTIGEWTGVRHKDQRQLHFWSWSHVLYLRLLFSSRCFANLHNNSREWFALVWHRALRELWYQRTSEVSYLNTGQIQFLYEKNIWSQTGLVLTSSTISVLDSIRKLQHYDQLRSIFWTTLS